MNARDDWRRRARDDWRRRRAHWSLRVYAALLCLYPPSLRESYGGDMVQAFRDTLREEIRCHGRRGALRAWGVALGDLAVTLGREWPRELRSGWPVGRARRYRMTRQASRPDWVERWLNRAPRWGLSQLAPARRARFSAGMARRATMHSNFTQFTERGRKVLSLAQEEAQRFQHNYIGTEHILLGLIREADGVGARALTALGVDLEQARDKVEFIIGRGDRIVLGDIGLTPRAKKVIELAVDESRRLGHHYVGTEHLLLGLVREGEGIAAGVLESLSVNLERARAEVMTMLRMPGVTPSTDASAQSALGQVVPYLTLVCRDVEATAAFYVEALGARVATVNDARERALVGEGRMLRLPYGGQPGAGLLVALRAASAEEAVATLVSAVGAVELRFLAGDITALHIALAARNTASLTPLAEVLGAPMMRAFTVADPDGRLLRFQGIVRA